LENSTTYKYLQQPIEFLKGVGTFKADLLKKELSVYTYDDLLQFFPYKHLDKTNIKKIEDIKGEQDYFQFVGKIISIDIVGEKRSRRLIAYLSDGTGQIELVWFQGINWAEKFLHVGTTYLLFGKVGFYMGSPQISHPEIEEFHPNNVATKKVLDPIYPSTEKLKIRGLSGRQIAKITAELISKLQTTDIPENIPESILLQLKLMPRYNAYVHIHFPHSIDHYNQAVRRLKFEELFLAQVRTQLVVVHRNEVNKGIIFDKVGDLFTTFYEKYLPFELTNAQKRVIKEIRLDMAKGKQMNRLLQGDVGSGKTMVALMSMLVAVGNGYQACLMAPTEILAQQHYTKILQQLLPLPINVAILTGSSKAAQRRKLLAQLEVGDIHILIGTHALIEPTVVFKNLGLSVIDEQHRFGVAQRSQLWKKNNVLPHILVMTATPIPRTLAMTAYGDLETSIIDELPPGRKEIKTVHRYDDYRAKVMDFIKEEIVKGRQIYIVFPLIEESTKLDFENLMQGYENVKAYFPEPKYWVSMVHGKMKNEQKEENMRRFVAGETNIMVATTVIEVGVDVPNASVMVIESAEKFGLSQLHQLRGRVGRGSEKSFCILLTSNKLTKEGRERMKTMVSTNDGFKIAEKDLELRGPGDIEGTRQSGALDFKIADIVADKIILETARKIAQKLVTDDPQLNMAENLCIKNYMASIQHKTGWGKIS
jgi:ATP-dependent DNA helicase RecG